MPLVGKRCISFGSEGVYTFDAGCKLCETTQHDKFADQHTHKSPSRRIGRDASAVAVTRLVVFACWARNQAALQSWNWSRSPEHSTYLIFAVMIGNSRCRRSRLQRQSTEIQQQQKSTLSEKLNLEDIKESKRETVINM